MKTGQQLKAEARGGKTEVRYTSELEHRLAASAMLYTWEQFQALPGDPMWADENSGDSKAVVIATYRAKREIEAVWR